MTNPLSIVYFPAALLLGALHALEPGHAKILTASYLIGIKGTKRDSIVLGLSVALTHSIVVVLISVLGLWLGNEAFAGQATEWMERGSGLVAIAIGSWMLWRRTSKRFRAQAAEHHHHAPEPVSIAGRNLNGTLGIIDTPLGERMRFTATGEGTHDALLVEIDRKGGETERLILEKSPDEANIYLSTTVPGEPHEFSARILWAGADHSHDQFEFSMKEPGDHQDHAHMDDIAHAKEHAADLPDYAKRGERPTTGQIIAFGAAGGMIPCPASITVMLLALAAGKTSMGLFTVMGFSIGLAVTLVAIGMVVVSGLSRIKDAGRFAWVAKYAPAISAGLVICSGLFALLVAHKS